MQEKENLMIVLEAIRNGQKHIYERNGFNYSLTPQAGYEEVSTESRLIFELFGEYPLSAGNQEQYLKIRGAFKLPEKMYFI